MQTFSHSEAGHNHQNEDVLRVRRHANAPHLQLCVLADGQGGQFGGGRAALVAANSAIEDAIFSDAKKLNQEKTWCKIIDSADEAVENDAKAGYTTLIALSVDDDSVCGASCGDSAILLVNNGKPIFLTERQHKNPPVGSASARPIGFSQKLRSPWKLLVMSDGVWKYVGWNAIIETCQSHHGADLVSELRKMATGLNVNLPDDFSLALFES